MRRNFIFAGQSNNSGRGIVSQVPAYANSDRMFLYGNDGVWKLASEPFDSNVGQIDNCSNDENAGAGPALAFANRMCELFPEDEVGIIPCAMGSTNIDQWRRLPTRDNLYGSMIGRAMDAESEGVLSGLVWWQGEAESLDSSKAVAWREKFGQLVGDIRVDLAKLSLPIAFVRLNNLAHQSHPYWGTVRTYQNKVYIPKVVMVSSDGVSFQSDNVHCTTAGYQDMGVRMADCIFSIM